MRHIELGGFTRISKTAAHKAYKAGKTVYLCPVNMRPDNIYCPALPLDNVAAGADDAGAVEWNQLINEFEWYNCTDTETGSYAAYYIRRN